MTSEKVVLTPGGLRFKVLVVNAQPLTGSIGAPLLQWARNGIEDDVIDGLMLAAGDSVYAFFDVTMTDDVRRQRATFLSGLMVRAKKEWKDIGSTDLGEEIFKAISEDQPDEKVEKDLPPSALGDEKDELIENRTPDLPHVQEIFDLIPSTLEFLRKKPMQAFVSDTSRSKKGRGKARQARGHPKGAARGGAAPQTKMTPADRGRTQSTKTTQSTWLPTKSKPPRKRNSARTLAGRPASRSEGRPTDAAVPR